MTYKSGKQSDNLVMSLFKNNMSSIGSTPSNKISLTPIIPTSNSKSKPFEVNPIW